MLKAAPFLCFLMLCNPHTREVMGSIPIGSTDILQPHRKVRLFHFL